MILPVKSASGSSCLNSRLKYTPDIETGTLWIEAVCENAHGRALRAEARFAGEPMGQAQGTVSGRVARVALKLQKTILWSTDSPALERSLL